MEKKEGYKMKYMEIKNYDIANGDGVRVSLFVSGCTHRCKGCFNEVAWDFHSGQDFTKETAGYLLRICNPQHISGLSLLGGEPFEPINQRGLLPLLKEFKKRYPQKNVWCYTGYTYEIDILRSDGKAHCEVTDELLTYIDIMVDGEFVEDLKDISLAFRGSSNQRILNIHNTSELPTI